MDEKTILKKYLQEKIKSNNSGKTKDCPSSNILSNYLTNSLDPKKKQTTEEHLASCGFCLKQISIASEAIQKEKRRSFPPVPNEIIHKIKSHLDIATISPKSEKKKRKLKEKLYLAATVIFFILSFLVPRYFIQFLVGSLILGIRWSFESKGGQTLIMVLDSWRRQSHDKDQQISNRLKDYFKK